jgi:hypothetical protein
VNASPKPSKQVVVLSTSRDSKFLLLLLLVLLLLPKEEDLSRHKKDPFMLPCQILSPSSYLSLSSY